MRNIFYFIFFTFLSLSAHAQITVSGTVLDNSKQNFVEGVRVISTGGKLAFTDSMGHYNIQVMKGDSLFFIYNNKPTQKFAVSGIANVWQFDLALQVPVKSKYSVLKEVIVYSKTHRQDSLDNREDYNNIFSYHKPGVSSSITPGGGVGMDLDEFINIFRFRRNKHLKAFQTRLENEEKDKYIDYRFSKITVRRITGLTGAPLDTFLRWYRPSYEFTEKSSEVVFKQFILNAYYQYHRMTGQGELKKEDDGNELP